ncbi:hypothetical protein F5Y13DRAFT_174083 [Hypoxylon sp. FL1857]|nr:hypothetical protein F5Y13DRAFT_174083 [Hypoxylon sp. FL1857]
MSDGEQTPIEEEYHSPPPPPVQDTDDQIKCSSCGEEDYFTHTGDQSRALCKNCGHERCSECS